MAAILRINIQSKFEDVVPLGLDTLNAIGNLTVGTSVMIDVGTPSLYANFANDGESLCISHTANEEYDFA